MCFITWVINHNHQGDGEATQDIYREKALRQGQRRSRHIEHVLLSVTSLPVAFKAFVLLGKPGLLKEEYG